MAFQNHSERLSTFQKFKGGVMDINKEREAYLKMLVGNDAISNDQADALKLMSGNSHFYTYGNQVSVAKLDLINWGWNSWVKAKSQAIPEGFVVVAKELPEKIAEKMAIDRIDKPIHANDPVWSEIAEESYKNQVKLKKWEFWRDYKAMIEAQEPAND